MAAGANSGGVSAVDDMKRLHAAVVAKQAAAATLSSYVPQRVAEKLAAGEVETRGARGDGAVQRHPRVLDDGRAAGGDEIAEIVGRHLSAMAEIVVEHLGMIDKFQGDAVMAVFGAPTRSPTTPSAPSAARSRCSAGRPS